MDRNFSPWAYWRLLQDRTPDPPPVPDDPAAALGWAAEVRTRLAGLIGADPEPVDPQLELGGPIEEPHGSRRRVVFDSEAGMSVPAWLVEPAAPRPGAPALLVLHGHGLDKDGVCGVGPGPFGTLDYGRRLAAEGFTVLAPDLRGFGERTDGMLPAPPAAAGPVAGTASPAGADDIVEGILRHQADCGWDLVCALLAGTTPMARNLWDLRRSLDVLGTIAPGNPERFGVVGWSYGAALAVLLAAVDDRVAAAVASGFVSSWRAAHRVPWNLCGRQVLPGLLGDLEHRDVAALVAPRALLVESAQDDLLAPADEAERTVAEIRRAYGLLGADPAVVEHDVVPGGHDWDGRSVVAFLDDHLTG